MDLDGVVYPFVKAWHRYAASEGRIAPELGRTTSVAKWGFYKDYGMDDADFASSLHSPDLFKMCEPSQATLANWPAIYAESYLHVITSRPSFVTYATNQWLEFWGLKFHRLSVIGHNQTKAAEIDNPTGRPVIAVDDLPSVLEQYKAAGVGTTLLVRREYNRAAWVDYTNISSIERVRDFTESVKHD